VLLWDVATHLARAVLVQPIFELVLRGSSHLTQTTQICFQSPRPALPVRLLVNRCGSRRSSGDPRTLLTATAALPGVPEITDMEEATGSNPVSPTCKPFCLVAQ